MVIAAECMAPALSMVIPDSRDALVPVDMLPKAAVHNRQTHIHNSVRFYGALDHTSEIDIRRRQYTLILEARISRA